MSGLNEAFTPELIQKALIYLIALILSIAVHEFGHAWVADRLGDPLPRSQGRVTLNPAAHIDPIGTIFFPLLGFILAAHLPPEARGRGLLGWGKPVYTSHRSRWLRGRMSEKTANLLISAAGPGMNILFALALSTVFVILSWTGHAGLGQHVGGVVQMNIGLAFFNLIPCPPLDGRSILFWFLRDGHPVEEFLQKYGPFLFFALLFSGALSIVMLPASILAGHWMELLRALGR